jgi:hypothetical protein
VVQGGLDHRRRVCAKLCCTATKSSPPPG